MSDKAKGASADADRAVVNGAGQAVSALRASVPSATCDSCQFLGRIYWDNGSTKTHVCGKSAERRRASFRSSGDFADDFMSEFRKFYDASAGQKACGHYVERELLPTRQLSMLQAVSDEGKAGLVAQFFSEENRLCGEMRDKFVDGGSFAYPLEPARGERRWFLTKVGAAELARAAQAIEARRAETAQQAPSSDESAVHEVDAPR